MGIIQRTENELIGVLTQSLLKLEEGQYVRSRKMMNQSCYPEEDVGTATMRSDISGC